MIDSPAIEKELAKRMDELKRHPEELMRYDRNGDGVIDEQEWAEIRKILRLEIATDQQRAARQTTPHDNASSYERQILRGRYIYQEKIGEGSQGVTWLALDQETGQPVLVKIVGLERLDECNSLEMLERNMQTLQRLNHPAVPAYIDSFPGEAGDASYILIREYVEGTDLREQIASSP